MITRFRYGPGHWGIFVRCSFKRRLAYSPSHDDMRPLYKGFMFTVKRETLTNAYGGYYVHEYRIRFGTTHA